MAATSNTPASTNVPLLTRWTPWPIITNAIADANEHRHVGRLPGTPLLCVCGVYGVRGLACPPARTMPTVACEHPPATHRAASGTQVMPASPMYSLSGLISRLSACCSITCAVHPAILETENTGVNRSVGMPR